MNPKTIGENIRRYREERLWTQEQLASCAGIAPRTIQRAEGGQRIEPESLMAIAHAFEMSIEQLWQDHPELDGDQPQNISLSWGCTDLDAIWWSKADSDKRSLYNAHVQTCPTCRDKKRRLFIDWRGFDDLKETIEQWVIDAGLIDLKRALHFEDTLSLDDVLSQEQIQAMNARFKEAERQWSSADLEAVAGIWEALDRDLIEVLERTRGETAKSF